MKDPETYERSRPSINQMLVAGGLQVGDQGMELMNNIFWPIIEEQFGEGNGTPLQYSCLENPMDGGAWQAAVHGVARVGHD